MSSQEQGFSIIYVLIAALVLIAGTATMMNRSTSTVLGSIFQGQSWQSRDVARIGMSYLISQINTEKNRHLLAVLDSQIDINASADQTLLTDSQASAYHFNPCITALDTSGTKINTPPSLSDLNLGSAKTNGGFLYIDANGSISNTRNGATRAFLIVTTDPANNFRLARKTSLFLLDDTQTKGAFRLSVEAVVYRNGQSTQVVSSTVLQEDFSVIPKCCKVPFGGYRDPLTNVPRGHGNNNYAVTDRTNLASNSCMLPGLNPNGFGILVGADSNGGSIEATGGPVIKDGSGTAINPVYCISTDPTKCTAAYNDSNNQMDRLDIELSPPPQYPGRWSGTPPALMPCSSVASCPSNASAASGSSQLMQYIGGKTVFNAAAANSSTQLPGNCTLYRNDIHCIYSSIDMGPNDNLVFLSGSGTRQIRLYFPLAGYVLKQQVGGSLAHCKDISCPTLLRGPQVNNVTDLSFFGCSLERGDTGCGAQTFDIKGAGNGARFYIYAPVATVKLTGMGAFQGVLWVKNLDMTGTTAAPTVSTSGVADVFILLGILPDATNTYNNSLTGQPVTTDLFAWDMVARSTNRFRFFGN